MVFLCVCNNSNPNAAKSPKQEIVSKRKMFINVSVPKMLTQDQLDQLMTFWQQPWQRYPLHLFDNVFRWNSDFYLVN